MGLKERICEGVGVKHLALHVGLKEGIRERVGGLILVRNVLKYFNFYSID